MAEHKGSCWEDEALEGYALRNISESRAAALEEHLLICTHCQDRLNEVDAFIQAVRTVAPRLRAEASGKKPAGVRILGWIEALRLRGESLSPRAPVLTGALLMGLLIVGAPWGYRHWGARGVPDPAVVELEAFRSSSAPASTPGDRPVTIRMRGTGLPPATRYVLEVASLTGEREWARAVPAGGEWLEATTPSPLRAGQHFVRLYAQPGGALVREFSLVVAPSR